MKAAEASGLSTRKTESEIEENEANAEQLRAKPDIAAQQIELKMQALQGQMERARDANERAALSRELQFLKMQQMENQFKEREGRLERMFGERAHVDAGTRDRLATLASSRKQLQQIQQVLTDPEVGKYLGPIMGRITIAQMTKGGGFGTNPKQREALIRVSRAFNTAANAFGGKVLPPNEQERVAKSEVYETDTLEQMLQKAQLGQDLYTREIERRALQLPPAGRRQQYDFLSAEGIDPNELFGPNYNQDTSAAVPVTSDSVQPGVPAGSAGKAQGVVGGGANAPTAGGGTSAGPAVGARKTFPNGTIGEWDGRGWRKVQ
jgi:hypothetical protein